MAPSPVAGNKAMITSESRMMGTSARKNITSTNQDTKSRLLINNNVIVPGKASSNITRKGPHKNIINSNIASRKYEKAENPE